MFSYPEVPKVVTKVSVLICASSTVWTAALIEKRHRKIMIGLSLFIRQVFVLRNWEDFLSKGKNPLSLTVWLKALNQSTGLCSVQRIASE